MGAKPPELFESLSSYWDSNFSREGIGGEAPIVNRKLIKLLGFQLE
jgi:hypothetical protein